MKIEGNEIIIRATPGRVALHLRVIPPHTIEVLQLDMRIGECHLALKENLLKVGCITSHAEFYLGFERLECTGAEIGVCVDESCIPFDPHEVSIAVGEIHVKGAGIKLALGSGGTTIRGLVMEEATKEQTVISEYPLLTGLSGPRTIYPARI